MAGSPSGVETTLPGFGAAYLHNPKPVYPPLARKMGIEGKVTLKVFVSKDGKPLELDVADSSGNDLLDKAAFDAVKNWRFVPARKGDVPHAEWVQVPIAFKLNR
jgi:protein TonB